MSTLLQRVHSTPGLMTRVPQKPLKISEVLIHRICNAYSPEEARREGIYYWPEPLPTPYLNQLADPLILFPTDQLIDATRRQALVPMSIAEILTRRNPDPRHPSLQIPLGLIDRPEVQQRDTLLIDLRGSNGGLTGGPLLIVGSQHSGKATALQTLLLWFAVRYRSAQFRCAVIDPGHDLAPFKELPHLRNLQDESLWTDGETDEDLLRVIKRYQAMLSQRRALYPRQHWTEDTLDQFWSQGTKMPLLLCVISNYQRFLKRPQALSALQELATLVTDSQASGAYLVLTTSEAGMSYLPQDLVARMGTKIYLYLDPSQRSKLLGIERSMEPIPGRGLLLTRDRPLNEIQLALPTRGSSESERYQQLSYAIECCTNS
ncbi:FtsK/SpoIIIE domain-containing protein [Tengunoibacter tsumagoiensis]|uniref:FtsK domain-containing protein n=1 Tax=Tengunoibacter tsumagoiensis TaxID=2014871 RepID=A0A401ZV61_9CHLR|nr:FtsK/SpoIIIE domain-containing protein [Tengunoibacter tsumagoiensis]GCE10805.1 hypothetical protein KTT_06640 [Tengunoibacter tsumagoiensis]